jgi:hypothetical protein
MFILVADDSRKATSSHMNSPGDPSQAWPDLAPDYERARSRQDSLHRHPHKQEWMNKYLGILIFTLQPLPAG